MQNSGQTHFKRTSVDNFLNRLVLYIGCFLVVLAVICTIGHILFESIHGKHFQAYLPWNAALLPYEGSTCTKKSKEDCKEGHKAEIISGKVLFNKISYFTDFYLIGLLIFWSYIIILNTLVPISLYVSVEIIRLGQSFFINWDRQMYYEPKVGGN